jgi:predicted Zn-dependent protease with MMP-like domain
LRRFTEIENEVDKVLNQISNQNSISELKSLPLENLILIVSSYVGIEIADKANLQGEGDDYVTLRNQVKQYVKNNFRDEIKSFLEDIKKNN